MTVPSRDIRREKPDADLPVFLFIYLFIYFNLRTSKVIHTNKNDINSHMENPEGGQDPIKNRSPMNI